MSSVEDTAYESLFVDWDGSYFSYSSEINDVCDLTAT